MRSRLNSPPQTRPAIGSSRLCRRSAAAGSPPGHGRPVSREGRRPYICGRRPRRGAQSASGGCRRKLECAAREAGMMRARAHATNGDGSSRLCHHCPDSAGDHPRIQPEHLCTPRRGGESSCEPASPRQRWGPRPPPRHASVRARTRRPSVCTRRHRWLRRSTSRVRSGGGRDATVHRAAVRTHRAVDKVDAVLAAAGEICEHKEPRPHEHHSAGHHRERECALTHRRRLGCDQILVPAPRRALLQVAQRPEHRHAEGRKVALPTPTPRARRMATAYAVAQMKR
jgi:hypothetical protein